jgi:hypothetical protein
MPEMSYRKAQILSLILVVTPAVTTLCVRLRRPDRSTAAMHHLRFHGMSLKLALMQIVGGLIGMAAIVRRW